VIAQPEPAGPLAPAPATMPPSAIRVVGRHRRQLGDLGPLVRSIEEVGLLHPVVVTPDGRLVAGQRRLEAWKRTRYGAEPIPVRVLDLADVVRAEYDENARRLDFTPSELVAVERALRPLVATPVGRPPKNGANLAPFPRGKTRDKVAAFGGVSHGTLDKAREVVEAAEAEPEKYAPLVEEMDRTRRVSGVFKKLRVARVAERIRAEPLPLPGGRYRVIVADPPWMYDVRADDPGHRVAGPYPRMTIEAIRALPVGQLAQDDCVLWLWTTNAHLEVAFGVARAWGFEPKSVQTWGKDRMGAGQWLRGQTEHCLFATRGRPTVVLTNQTTLLLAPVREHSRKPERFYAQVEQMCPGSKVDLFAREARPGWDSWGAEAPEPDVVEDAAG
jgi:N6-adenosine-specific RNA methylase IME4